MKIRSKLVIIVSAIVIACLFSILIIFVQGSHIFAIKQIESLSKEALSNTYELRFETATLFLSITDINVQQKRWYESMLKLKRTLQELENAQGWKYLPPHLRNRIEHAGTVWELTRDKYDSMIFQISDLVESSVGYHLHEKSISTLIQMGMSGVNFEDFGISRWSTMKDTLSFIELSAEDFQSMLISIVDALQMETQYIIDFTLITTIVYSGLVLIISVFFMILFGRKLVTNIEKVEIGIKMLAHGDFSTQIDIKSNDEFGYLSKNFSRFKKTLHHKISSILDFHLNIDHKSKDNLKFSKVIRLIIETAVRKTSADSGCILFKAETSEVLYVKELVGFFPLLPPLDIEYTGDGSKYDIREYLSNLSIPFGRSILGETADKEKPVFIKENLPSSESPFSSLIIVPFFREDALLGIMALIKNEADNFFTDLDFLYSKTFAEYSELTIDNLHKFDEIYHLNEIYRYSKKQVNRLKRNALINDKIMKIYHMQKLFYYSSSMTLQELSEIKERFSLSVDLTKPLVIIIISLQRSQKISINSSEKSISDLYNVELNFSVSFPFETIEIEGLRIVGLINCMNITEYRELQDSISSFKINSADDKIRDSVILMSSIINSYKDISDTYQETLSGSVYDFIYNDCPVITDELIKKNRSSQKKFISDFLKNRLISNIHDRNISDAKNTLEEILSEVKQLDYNSIVISLISLVNDIKKSLETTALLGQKKYSGKLDMAIKSIFEVDSINDFKDILENHLEEIVKPDQNEISHKNQLIVNAMKSFIDENYFDSTICLKHIAGVMKMSSVYLGKVFKSNVGISVHNYINDIRLAKAKELLSNTTLTVSEISEKIGIENESYFYKLFKKKYNLTPKQFSQKNGLDSLAM